MESAMITPSTNLTASAVFKPNIETKIETKNIEPVKIETKVENNNVEDPKVVSQELNKMSDSLNLDIKFAYNEKINTVYINVTDKNTGEVIRKLPTEEAMKIKESMQDLVGVLFDKKG